MAAFELIRETLLRKHTILLAHVLLFMTYSVCYVWQVTIEVAVFFMAGIVLPLVLTNGIWGNDISSGRIRVLALTPTGVKMIHAWRLLGVLLQGAVHVAAVAGVLVLVSNTGSQPHCDGPVCCQYPHVIHRTLGLHWIACILCLFLSMAAISTTLSIVVRGEHNSPLVLLILIFMVFGGEYLSRAEPSAFIDFLKSFSQTASYLFPPVTALLRAGYAHSAAEIEGICLRAVAQALVYAGIGLAILHHMEHRPQGAGESA